MAARTGWYDRLVEDYDGQIPLWEKIMDRQGSVCCAWERTSFEEGLKVGIRLMWLTQNTIPVITTISRD
ncbi:hypothetical protein RO787_05420 [Blautia coccoides]|uniref:hypothetical protein n=1 Tax=Blautia producta TaxID=33035 RepID=UPI0028A2F941|nr:hypothetical protein [Blautia coccoides]MDT4372787.1 hypothetical protein [Blautia coccoides]